MSGLNLHQMNALLQMNQFPVTVRFFYQLLFLPFLSF